MPAAAVWVLAVLGTVAAGLAFHQFVYEPHLAPKIELWAEEFIAKRKARRRQRAAAVSASTRRSRSRSSDRSGSDDDDDRKGAGRGRSEIFELGNLGAPEVQEWRSEVVRSQTLRRRANAHQANNSNHTLDEPTTRIPYSPLNPNHVISNSSAPSTPSSTLLSTVPSPPPQVSTINSSRTSSRTTLRSPPAAGSLPATLALNRNSSSPPPIAIASLSQTYAPDLDQEHGIELLSPPSSRADSPFVVSDYGSRRSGPVSPVPLSPVRTAALQPLSPSPSSDSDLDSGSFSFSPVSHPGTLSPPHFQPLSPPSFSPPSDYHSFSPSSPTILSRTPASPPTRAAPPSTPGLLSELDFMSDFGSDDVSVSSDGGFARVDADEADVRSEGSWGSVGAGTRRR